MTTPSEAGAASFARGIYRLTRAINYNQPLDAALLAVAVLAYYREGLRVGDVAAEFDITTHSASDVVCRATVAGLVYTDKLGRTRHIYPTAKVRAGIKAQETER